MAATHAVAALLLSHATALHTQHTAALSSPRRHVTRRAFATTVLAAAAPRPATAAANARDRFVELVQARAPTSQIDAAVDALPAELTSRAASSLDAGLAIERLEKCVVGTQEDWAGARRAIDHWFPWLSFDDDVRRNVGFSDAETRQTLRPELSAAIEKCNACDLAVYEAATRRVEAQKEFLDERAAILVAERGARAG